MWLKRGRGHSNAQEVRSLSEMAFSVTILWPLRSITSAKIKCQSSYCRSLKKYLSTPTSLLCLWWEKVSLWNTEKKKRGHSSYLACMADTVVLKPPISHLGYNLSFLNNYPNDKCWLLNAFLIILDVKSIAIIYSLHILNLKISGRVSFKCSFPNRYVSICRKL